MRRKRRSLPSRIARWVAGALFWAAFASVAAVLVLRWAPPPVTAFMVHERRAAAREGLALVQRYDWVPAANISRHAGRAVIAAEDQNFYAHRGFDFAAIERAVAEAQRGKRLRGASTLTQQVAKNLFLWPGQSWVRKGLEAWFTMWIEVLWPKERILEVYLNVAQFGRGLWGVEAASRACFGKPAARLAPHEAALLAAVLPNPTRLLAAKPSPYVRQRQAWILDQMQRLR